MVRLDRAPMTDIVADWAKPGLATTLSLWWLGQAGFLLRFDQFRMVIDPYLSDTLAQKYAGTAFPHQRMMHAPVAPADLKLADVVLCTHAHTDHMDPGTLRPLAATAPDARFIVPAAETEKAVERGVPRERLIGADADQPIEVTFGVTILPVPAAHEDLRRDVAGRHHFLGFVVRVGGIAVYHSGDCVPYDGLVERLAPHGIDLALLPVNGRDAERASRGVPGNFHLQEAVALCRSAGVSFMLGHHFGMFDFNTIDEAGARIALQSEGDGFALVEAGIRYDLSWS